MPVFHSSSEPWTGRSDPEDGPLAKRVFEFVSKSGSRAVIGFASEAGVARNKGRTGAKEGPAALRKSLGGLAAPHGFASFVDLGDVVVDGDDLEAGQKQLGEHIDRALETYDRVMVFGGGHDTAYGSYLGLSTHFPDKKIGIINLDAHLDLRNIGAAGPSSGTPFNQIRQSAPEAFDYLCIGVARESNTQALLARAKEWGVEIVFDDALLRDADGGREPIISMAQRCDIIYLTIDIDLMPHFQAPGVSAPAARGVPFATVEHLVDTVQQACTENDCALPLVDLVELSPIHDINGMTAKTAAVLALSLMT